SPHPLIDRLVQTHIIHNWEAQDEPEHLKTIRDRLLRNQQKAGQLLGLYQQVLQQGRSPPMVVPNKPSCAYQDWWFSVRELLAFITEFISRYLTQIGLNTNWQNYVPILKP
ncbi:MAG: hypothetical protein HC866_04565, partial [Leptolyngbyaceae cyanobacterium RU_5_1]|nr:hypothetical protein [Leptolyngbyaceae cyanobacterium RU_5_1]